MANVLQSIKNAEEAADAKIAASKEEAAKIVADARMEAARSIAFEPKWLRFRHG